MTPTRPATTPTTEDREARRLAALRRLEILDTLPEAEFDDLVLLASQVCDMPIALVSLIDANRQWFKARIGLTAQQTSRDVAFCARAIETPDDLFIVEDASRDPRFRDNPLVTGDLGIRFYAGAPIVDPHGNAFGTVCVIDTAPATFDATRRRCLQALARHASLLLTMRGDALAGARAEVELIERNETLEQDADRRWAQSDDLLVRLDRDGRVLRASRSWTALLGFDERALQAMRFDDLVAVNIADAADGTPVERRMEAADGSSRWMSWTWTVDPVHGHVDGVGRDVTEAHERQVALEAAEAALRQSQKMEALGQLTGGLAHDFNNLLTGITGSLELMQLRIAAGRVRELDRYLVAAQGAAKRAAALTHRLLAFARRQTLDPRATDVNRLVADMEELVRRTVGPQIVLAVAPAPELWPAMVDANQLENALLNLCINARDAMPGGGRLTIVTANVAFDDTEAAAIDLPRGQYLALSVGDTGTGMSDEVVKRAFEPFFTTKPLGAGTGLGLSMAYGFARQSGGQMHIASTIGRGTTMSIYLPRHHGDGAVDRVEASTVSAPHAGLDEIVLIVDDEPTVRMLVAEVLDELGYRSIEAHDGASGLAVLQSGTRVDLLVTDVGLPGGLNGRQVADAARALRPALKVLFITGYAENAVIGQGDLDAGMQILTKPFALEALARRVGEMLAEG